MKIFKKNETNSNKNKDLFQTYQKDQEETKEEEEGEKGKIGTGRHTERR